MPTVMSQATPTARKPHRCELCGRTIHPGERYDRSSNLGDGHLYTWKECLHCKALAALLWALDVPDYDYGLGPDDVGEWEPQTVPLLRLKALFLRRWTRTDGTLYPVPRVVWNRRYVPYARLGGLGWPWPTYEQRRTQTGLWIRTPVAVLWPEP